MFNSTILDVAIGMIFVYLLLSLICSAANEIIESFAKKRASDLERGISELLDNNPTVVKSIYEHPLIYSLFLKPYNPRAKNLPSYIPARNFALALLDFATSSPAPSAATIQPAPSQVNAGIKSDPAKADAETIEVRTEPAATTAQEKPGTVESLAAELKVMRATIEGNQALPDNTKKALLALVDASLDNPAKLRKNIEDWFDSSMDRVSGWYKRRSQLIVMFLGLVLAVALNVDSVALVRSLATERAMRDSLVAAAQEYAKNNSPAQTASPAQPAPSGQSARPIASPTPCITSDTPECRVQNNLDQIKKLGVPIGWTKQSFNDFKGGAWPSNILGWLITALALSLGAPFWFDLLNKFIVIRSTVKPKEKSPEEASKD
jgi:hypothetical protein